MATDRRTRGFGSLEKRRGVYLARWIVDGKRYSKALGTGDRRKAERMLAEITAPFRLTTERDRLKAIEAKVGGIEEEISRLREREPGVLVADAWEAYVHAPERPDTCGEKALTDHGARWGTFARFMAERYPDVRELRHVGRLHVVEWVKQAEAGRSAKTFNLMVRQCRAVWRVLAENPENKLDGDRTPFDSIRRRREITQSRRRLTVEELVRVLAEARGEERVLFLIGMYTGLRLADAATLLWSSVDLVAGVVRVVPRKTARYGKEVTVPIHPKLAEALAGVPFAERNGYVLKRIGETYDGSERGRDAVRNGVEKVFKACGIETHAPAKDGGNRRSLVGFHSLRHTFVTMEVERGAPAFLVQSMVGHSNMSMTAHYFHASVEGMRASVCALPDFTDPEGAKASRGVLDAFRAMVDTMAEGERREALEYLRSKVCGEVIEIEDGQVRETVPGVC